MKPRKPIYVTSEEARKTHSQTKLHKFMQDEYDPVGGMRDSQKIKDLIKWQRLWIGHIGIVILRHSRHCQYDWRLARTGNRW